VPGEGNPNTDIVFIGEGPGFHEDQQARPFVGAAGKFLDELLASIGLHRKDVYICNVIKCRPPGNRDPLPAEIESCKPWLDQQLDAIRPKVIVTLGRFSMGRYFTGQTISRIHGQPRSIDGVTVVPMYHPAAALHQGSLRRTIEQDFKKLPGILSEALQAEPEPAEPEPVQMQLL
jgi:DNA polymerase